MSNIKTGSLLPKFETLVIAVFLVIFVIWALTKCNNTKKQIHAAEEAPVVEEDTAATAAAPSISLTPLPPAEDPIQSTEEKLQSIRERYTPLFVTIEGMNLREEPKLNGKILARMELFEEVTFLNEVTDFTQAIALGDTTTVAPWIKVKTNNGKVGWVYGAGLHYYKYKLEGVD